MAIALLYWSLSYILRHLMVDFDASRVSQQLISLLCPKGCDVEVVVEKLLIVVSCLK